MEGTKVETKGINIIEEVLQRSHREDATISISHKLYGEQKLKLKLDCILDEKRIGFKVVNGQEIFIYKKDLISYGIKDGIYFADELMMINIKIG